MHYNSRTRKLNFGHLSVIALANSMKTYRAGVTCYLSFSYGRGSLPCFQSLRLCCAISLRWEQQYLARRLGSTLNRVNPHLYCNQDPSCKPTSTKPVCAKRQSILIHEKHICDSSPASWAASVAKLVRASQTIVGFFLWKIPPAFDELCCVVLCCFAFLDDWSHVRGSPPYYQHAFYDLLAMIHQLGTPNMVFHI